MTQPPPAHDTPDQIRQASYASSPSIPASGALDALRSLRRDQPASLPGEDVAMLLGRFALVAIFLGGGFAKLEDLGGLEGTLAVSHVPLPGLAAVIAAVVEFGGAIAILLGWRTRAMAIALIAFTVVATLLFHPFWNALGAMREDQYIHFMKNVGLVGGLLLLSATGPGRLAIVGKSSRPVRVT